MKNIIESYCGLRCHDCEHKKSGQCEGCAASGGRPFHGFCEIAQCAIQREKRFCGECEKLPCELITRYANDPEHGDGGARIVHCQELKAALVKEAREGVNPVSVCGHHCDYCFLGQWCGGCRSGYNCCSFATVFEDGRCPNVACAQERKLDGCYQCQDLLDCKKGYYGKENEYIAKATALFIGEHGEDCYTKTLARAIDGGLQYPGSFDAAGSAEAALALLKTYLP